MFKNESDNSEMLNADNKPRGNVVVRQELKSLTPKCDANCAITFNICLMIVFIVFGIPIIITSNQVVEFTVDYTKCEKDKMGYCNVTLTTNITIPAPVYFYYEIDNFYMNHRDFVKSRSFPQLRGDVHVDSSDNSRCEGARYISEIFDNDTSKYSTYKNLSLKSDDFANPCGLIAKSFFNDTEYTLYTSSGKNIRIDDTNIANDYDKKYMFKRHANSSSLQWIDVEDEYNVTSFNGKKLLVFSNSSSIGTGAFFGFILIFGAAFCLLLVIILYILKKKNEGKVYNINDLKWD